MFNRKAVSTVVATVLIILITVAAVALIWAAIIPLVKDDVDRGKACFDAQSDISLVTDQGYTCVNNTGGDTGANISFQIRKGRNSEITLVGVEALVFVGGNSFKFRFNQTQGDWDDTNMGGILPGVNGESVLYVNSTSIGNATRLKIVPVVSVGNSEEVCEIAGDVLLDPCS